MVGKVQLVSTNIIILKKYILPFECNDENTVKTEENKCNSQKQQQQKNRDCDFNEQKDEQKYHKDRAEKVTKFHGMAFEN